MNAPPCSLLSTAKHYLESLIFLKACPKQLAFLRISFGIALLINQTTVLDRFNAFYQEDGYFTSEYITSIFPDRLSLLFLPFGHFWPPLLYTMLVLATLLFTCGVAPRWMSLVMFILTSSFQNRDLFHTYGADSVIRHMLFFMIFLPTGRAWSLGRKSPSDDSEERPEQRVDAWALRLIQIQLALVYLFSGVSKLSSSDWMSGQYIYSMLNYPMRSYLPLLWLRELPIVVNLITYSTLILEIGFIFLVWFDRWRVPLVLIMGLFHIGIFFSYNVVYFSIVMVSLLPAFLSSEESARFRAFLHSRISQWRTRNSHA